ncbi:thiamine phosphate synthase [Alloacidobacterium sp.]|uniref:thiamine phosphate synthase n=1 Tax=Alloacidobacterium sp. TaxID=2951999 RepID=UPI002D74A410|nr:thiamine phosphate synthase [Alloacidobacterium sp.]HYK36179.1 thiamine phosphate synthase [Alloacidobacterium sp.]
MAFLLPPLYPIMDASFLPSFERGAYLMRVVCELEDAGVTLLQYRNKHSIEEIPHDAVIIRGGATSAVTLIMNDHPELAVNAGFDGVHVGQGDVSPGSAREIVGPDRIVGISTHNLGQLKAADLMPVDYIAFGPVFATTSKLNSDPVVGLDGVCEARSLTSKPLVAIGGITLENARAVRKAGADSVAVISAMFGPDENPVKIAKDFLRIFR